MAKYWQSEIVPSHWGITTLINVCEKITDGSHFSPEIQSTGRKYITVSNLFGDKVHVEEAECISETDFEQLVQNGCQPQTGDVLLSKDGTVGRTAIVEDNDFVVLSSLGILRPKNMLISRFLKYSLDSDVMQEQMRSMMAGAALKRITLKKIQSLQLAIPPINEQKNIANYLDDRCSKVDAVIAEAKASIEEYKELKQAVIYEAVTKGLDKNVEMKDSGIEWIGKIPSNWIMTKLKYLLKSPLQYGANAIGVEYDEKLPRYVRITDISVDGTLKNDNKQSLPFDVSQEYILDIGDVLFARSGGTVGKAFLYNKNDGLCAFAGYLIRAKCRNEVIAKFLYYYTMSSSYNIWKNGIFSQATIQNISAEKYANMPLPLPTELDELRSIILFIDEYASKIEAMISEKQSLIEDLESYKKSLIYEVVTGKRKVVE